MSLAKSLTKAHFIGMRAFALLLLPWVALSVWVGPVVYLLGFTVDAMIACSLPILIGVTVNVKTIGRIFSARRQSHQVPHQSESQSVANLNQSPQ